MGCSWFGEQKTFSIIADLQTKKSLIKGISSRIFASIQGFEYRMGDIVTITNLFQVFSVSGSQGVVNQVDYLGRSFAAKDTSKYNVVHYGDLVYH